MLLTFSLGSGSATLSFFNLMICTAGLAKSCAMVLPERCNDRKFRHIGHWTLDYITYHLLLYCVITYHLSRWEKKKLKINQFIITTFKNIIYIWSPLIAYHTLPVPEWCREIKLSAACFCRYLFVCSFRATFSKISLSRTVTAAKDSFRLRLMR